MLQEETTRHGSARARLNLTDDDDDNSQPVSSSGWEGGFGISAVNDTGGEATAAPRSGFARGNVLGCAGCNRGVPRCFSDKGPLGGGRSCFGCALAPADSPDVPSWNDVNGCVQCVWLDGAADVIADGC